MAKGAEQRKVKVNMDEVTFGVEIECTLPYSYVRAKQIEIGNYHHGTQLPAPFPMGWNAQQDGSLYAEAGYISLEIVSPVLTGLAGLQEVLRVYALLADAGMVVNESCGFHVHVGINSVLGDRATDEGLVVRWLRRMVNLVSVHELGLFAITGQRNRLDNRYCQTIKAQWDGVLATSTQLEVIADRVQSHAARYHTLNLCNLTKSKRTVEFRVFGATVDGMQALGYVITALGIAHRAAECGVAPHFDNRTAPVTEETCIAAVKALRGTLAHYGWPTGAEQWRKGIRQAQLASARQFAA